MDEKQKQLIELQTKLEFYQKLDKKIDLVLNYELDLDDWSKEVYYKILRLENEITDLDLEIEIN